MGCKSLPGFPSTMPVPSTRVGTWDASKWQSSAPSTQDESKSVTLLGSAEAGVVAFTW